MEINQKFFNLIEYMYGVINKYFDYDLLYKSMLKKPETVHNARRSHMSQQKRKKQKKSIDPEISLDYKNLIDESLHEYTINF
jgi:hypothetical protein